MCFGTGPSSADSRETDRRFKDRKFAPGPVSYFPGDYEIISLVILLLLIQEGLSVTSNTMCTKYWLTVKLSLPRKISVVR